MKTQRFWRWFLRNKRLIENFIETKSNKDYSIYNKLTSKIKKVNELLIPEITMTGDRFELIISCGGISDGIQAVKELYDRAPMLDNWVFTKFRQPKNKFDLNFNGLDYKYDDIKVLRTFDLENEKVNIALLIKNYDDNDKRYKSLAFLYLDHFIGEFNTMTRVGQIDFLSWTDLEQNKQIDSISLIGLKNEISEKLY